MWLRWWSACLDAGNPWLGPQQSINWAFNPSTHLWLRDGNPRIAWATWALKGKKVPGSGQTAQWAKCCAIQARRHKFGSLTTHIKGRGWWQVWDLSTEESEVGGFLELAGQVRHSSQSVRTRVSERPCPKIKMESNWWDIHCQSLGSTRVNTTPPCTHTYIYTHITHKHSQNHKRSCLVTCSRLVKSPFLNSPNSLPLADVHMSTAWPVYRSEWQAA